MCQSQKRECQSSISLTRCPIRWQMLLKTVSCETKRGLKKIKSSIKPNSKISGCLLLGNNEPGELTNIIFNVHACFRVSNHMICLLDWKAVFLFLLAAVLGITVHTVFGTAHEPQAEREREIGGIGWWITKREKGSDSVKRLRKHFFGKFTSQCCCQISCPPPSISLSHRLSFWDSGYKGQLGRDRNTNVPFLSSSTFIGCWTVLL